MKRKRSVRIFFWALFAAFVLLAIWWATYFPYRPHLLYHVVPPNATFASEHENLAARWTSMARTPLTLAVLEALGLDRQDVLDAVKDPTTASIVGKVAGRRTVLAYVPAFGQAGTGAWVFATWAGRHAQFLRWGFYSAWGSALTKIRMEDGHSAWVAEIQSKNAGKPAAVKTADLKLCMAATEGILVGCLTATPADVSYLLKRIERRHPINRRLAAEIERRKDSASGKRNTLPGPDRGWFRSMTPTDRWLFWTVTSLDHTGLSGWMDIPAAIPAAAALNPSPDMECVWQLAGKAACAAVVVPWSYLEPLTGQRDSPKPLQLSTKIFSELVSAETPVFASLFSGDYSGRVMGIRIPALVLAAKSAAGDQTPAALSNAFDRLNAELDSSLILRRADESNSGSPAQGGETPSATPGSRLLVIDTARPGIYGHLDRAEKPAFAMCDQWLVFSTSASTLKKLLRESATRSNATPGSDSDRDGVEAYWAKTFTAASATAYGFADLREASKAARNAAAVYSLFLIAGGGDKNPEIRENLDLLKSWLDTLSPLGACRLWLTPDGDRAQLSFKLGEPALP